MIHFAIGTKAQFIKMAPLMHLLENAGEHYHLLDLSQHGNLTGKILSDFGLSPRITRLRNTGKSVTTYFQAVGWFFHGIYMATVRRRHVREQLFLGQRGIVLLHGDTLSTLLGLYLARSAGLKTALVEAGLSSGSLFDPFPEEWIRHHTARKVDILFPPDEASESWLRSRNFRCPIINTGYNTGRDSLSLIVSRHGMKNGLHDKEGRFGVVTLHRLETLSSKSRLSRAIRHVIALADTIGPVKFYMHPPTENAMKKYELINELRTSSSIRLYGLEPYPQFIGSLMKARFVLTDGGSIQEETSYLMKPCLILRNRTERTDGIGDNAALASWNIESDVAFLRKGIDAISVTQVREPDMHASRVILESLGQFKSDSNIGKTMSPE